MHPMPIAALSQIAERGRMLRAVARRVDCRGRFAGTMKEKSDTERSRGYIGSMTLSVILPCFNEEQNIASSVRDVASWMKKEHISGEIIVVNDGSTDGSLTVLRKLESEIPHLRVVDLPKNGGYGIAVRAGCDAATTDLISFMDSDLQFHAEDLSLLLTHIDDYAFVTGRRAHRADSLVRNAFGKILGGMNVVVLGLWVRDVNCGMKMFRRDIWKTIRPVHGVEKLFNTEMFLRLKRNKIPWLTVNVPHYPRIAGNPTGGSVRVIIRMFWELWNLRTKI
jgi:glycosyltransferase involved in cell wall biosynthesis